LVALYLAFLVAVAFVRPEAVPPIPNEPEDGAFARVFKALVAPVLLIIVVLGSILIGLATPTEAAAVGAVGAILLAALRSARAQWAVGLCLGAFAVLMLLRAMLDLRDGLGFALALIVMAALAV